MQHTMNRLAQQQSLVRSQRYVLPDVGSGACSRPSTSGRVSFVPQAVLTTTTARLPATHLEASVKALEQLKASTVNREYT